MNNLYPNSPRPSRGGEVENYQSTSGIAGDAIPQKKNEDHIRVLLHNCSGIGAISGTERDKSSYKLTQLKLFALEKKVDLICLTETNTDWRMVPPRYQLWKVILPWYQQSRVTVSYNTTIKKNRRVQWGGTAMICANDLCPFEIGKDRSSDPRKLGRWTSMTFEGKMNTKITMITAYCSVNNANGLHSAFTQQLVYINKK